MNTRCLVPVCDLKACKRGYCNKHYIRLRRHGDPCFQRHNDKCMVPDCERKYSAVGYCKMHYIRHYKNGTTDKKSLRKYDVDDEFFSKESESVFYWAGFLAADGCVQRSKNIKWNTKYISLCLAKKDHNHLQKYKDCIGATNPIKKRCNNKKYERMDLVITSNQIFEDLGKLFNIIPNKTLTYTFPIWIINHPMVHHFIRGYFDGDGTVRIDNEKTMHYGILGTESFLMTVGTILNRNGIITKSIPRKRKNANVFDFRIGGNTKAKKITAFLYKDASIYLDRKRDIAIKASELGKSKPTLHS